MDMIFVITKWVNLARHIEGKAFYLQKDADEYIDGDDTLGYEVVKIK